MKWHHETIYINDATDLFSACNVLLSHPQMFPELEIALDFCRKMVEEYRVWLAYEKETGFPMKYRQQTPKAIIWTIHFGKKPASLVDEGKKP